MARRPIDILEFRQDRFELQKSAFEELKTRLLSLETQVKELNKAASRAVAGKAGNPTMLEVFDIEEGSRFGMFGVKNGDVVTLIDQNIIEFRDDRHVQLAQGLFDKLEDGESISFTVLRDGAPVHLEFSLGK